MRKINVLLCLLDDLFPYLGMLQIHLIKKLIIISPQNCYCILDLPINLTQNLPWIHQLELIIHKNNIITSSLLNFI